MSSKIEWTEETWNPVRGCSRISPGCVNCYAERMAARDLPGLKSPTTGEPFAVMTPSGPRWTGKVELIPHMLDVPLRRKKPTTYFVNSMSDLFHEDLADWAIDQIFAVMERCPQHTFQILTKRSRHIMEHRGPSRIRPILPNVWLGVSVEDQQRADERIPELLATPAAVRFLSVEPLLGPVNLRCVRARGTGYLDVLDGFGHDGTGEGRNLTGEFVDWVIVGGESGPGARPCDIAWIRSIVAQCKAAGVAVFVKQLGAHPYDAGTLPSERLLRDPKGGDIAEWPADLRVREMPKVAAHG